MMNNDDFNRGPQTQPSRKPFSPNRYGNSGGGFNYNYNQSNSFNGQQQHPRRRTDRFKRESLNTNDKIFRQNDIIIRLLKEIRDRLPPPPPGATDTEITATSEQGSQEIQSEAPQDQVIQQELTDDAAEPGNENIEN
jgi:hypothetical protein